MLNNFRKVKLRDEGSDALKSKKETRRQWNILRVSGNF